MTREKVDELLKNHRIELGRYGHLATQLAELERDINRENQAMVEDIASVGAQVITGMPKGNYVGNPTERAGLKLAGGWKSEKLLDLEERWIAVLVDYEESYSRVSYVNAWLSGLNERERWIIEHQVIDGEFWKAAISGFSAKFGEYVSKDTLKRIKDKALEKIYMIAE